MPNTDQFYTKETELFRLTKGSTTIKAIIGDKQVRGEHKQYFDLRAWYLDDNGILLPGKGFAKPFTKEELKGLADAINSFVSGTLEV